MLQKRLEEHLSGLACFGYLVRADGEGSNRGPKRRSIVPRGRHIFGSSSESNDAQSLRSKKFRQLLCSNGIVAENMHDGFFELHLATTRLGSSAEASQILKRQAVTVKLSQRSQIRPAAVRSCLDRGDGSHSPLLAQMLVGFALPSLQVEVAAWNLLNPVAALK